MTRGREKIRFAILFQSYYIVYRVPAQMMTDYVCMHTNALHQTIAIHFDSTNQLLEAVCVCEREI